MLSEVDLLVSFGGRSEFDLESDEPEDEDSVEPDSSVEAAAVVESSSCAWTSEHDTAKTTARRRNVIQMNRKNNLAEPGWLATILKEYLFGTAKGRAARRSTPWSDLMPASRYFFDFLFGSTSPHGGQTIGGSRQCSS